MDVPDMDEFNTEIRQFLFSNEQISSRDFMTLLDRCFKLCLNEQEHAVLVCLLECFLDLRARAAQIIDIDQGKYRYIVNHPIIVNKDVNERIAAMAFGHREQLEYLTFRAKAQSVHRMASYLQRFYIPQNRKQNKKVKVRGQQYPIRDIYDMLLGLWGEPPNLE